MRLKVSGGSRYSNSPKMGGSSITPTDAYQEEVQESFSPNLFYQEDTAELVEIESISKYNSCPKILSSNWVLKISCLKQNGETMRLIMFTECLKKLIPEKSIESYVPKELSTYILEAIDEVKVHYDPDKSIFIDIERL